MSTKVKDKVNYVDKVVEQIHRNNKVTKGWNFVNVRTRWQKDGSKITITSRLYTDINFIDVEDSEFTTVRMEYVIGDDYSVDELISKLIPLYEDALKDEELISIETNFEKSTFTYIVVFNFKVEEVSEEEKSRLFKRNATMIGLDSYIQYGMTFTYKGDIYTLVAINPRARRYPIEATSTSKSYMFTKDFIEAKFSGNGVYN